jgi:eukaryotic-like serine/threonine-protein kinase
MRPGERVNHFEILSSLGRGGMGEVWRAVDTRLRRDVALKTLPHDLARDSDRLARLEREAMLLAAVNHPNVATIHGVEERGDERFLVLELVEGPTLANRLARGPLEVRQAIETALQIAQALEAAHEKGVIHRDLKPENIKLAANGQVKVLDFGLAKDLAPSAADATRTQLTQTGAVMGTPAYMSPEQARGDQAGRQSDIWSFGAVLFEMLTGTAAFRSDTMAETFARVLERQPDYSALPANTPANVRHVLRRCLEKDTKRRSQHIGDVRIEIEDALAGRTEATGDAEVAHRFGAIPTVAVTLGAIAIVAAVGEWALRGRSAVVDAPSAPIRLSIASMPALASQPFGTKHIAISHDGSRVAYSAAEGLEIRRLSDSQTVVIGRGGTAPFFSPDGEWVGYGNSDAGIYKVASAGGAVTPIARFSERLLGADWAGDGTIVFATTAGLYRVSADGGDPELLAKPDPARNEQFYAWPSLLPDGRSLIFTILSPQDSLDSARVAWLDLASRESRIVLTGGIAGTYVTTGHIVYAAQSALHAIAFDAKTRATMGGSIALANSAIAVAADNGAAEFAISQTGTLVSIAPAAPNDVTRNSLVWIDHLGNEETLPLQPAAYAYPRISPDGTRVALDLPGSNRDIWIWDLRRSSLTRLTSSVGEDMLPLWSIDGLRLFFASNRAGTFDIYSQAADGSSEASVVLPGPLFDVPNSFSPDGKQLVVYEEFRDLGVLDLETGKFRLLLDGPADDRLGEVSPDGKWIAYESQEPGQRTEIYLRPFPNVAERREKVSIDGGRYPVWGRRGSNELYYVDLEGKMMAVAVETSPTLRLGAAAKLFDWAPPPLYRSGRPYDISPIDGRFLMTKALLDAAPSVDVSVVLNWFTELREQTRPR